MKQKIKTKETDLRRIMISGFSWTTIQVISSRILGLISQVLIARLVAPDLLGVVSISNSIISTLLLFQVFGVSEIIIAKRASTSVIKKSNTIVLFTSIICAIFLLNSSFLVNQFDNSEKIANYFTIAIFVIPFNAFNTIISSCLRSKNKFKIISISNLLSLLLNNAITISYLFLINKQVEAFAIGQLGSVFLTFWYLNSKIKINLFLYSFNDNLQIIKDSFFSFSHNFIQTLTRYIDNIVIGIYASAYLVGIYTVSYSLSVQVISLVVNAIGPIYFPILKNIPNEEVEKQKNVMLKTIDALALIGFWVAMIQLTIGKLIINSIYGSKWSEAILYLQILSLGIGFKVASSIWPTPYRIKDKFKDLATLSIISSIIFITIIFISAYFYSVLGVSIAVSVYNIIFSIVSLKLSLALYKVTLYQIFKNVMKYFLLSSLFFFPTLYIEVSKWFLVVLYKAVLPTIFYFSTLFFLKDKIVINGLNQVLITLNKKYGYSFSIRSKT